MTVVLSNNVSTTLNTAISASDTGLAVLPGAGALFPTLAPGQYFYATIEAFNNEQEIVKVTAVAGDNFSILRGQDGTTANSFSAGARVELRVTAGAIYDILSQAALTNWIIVNGNTNALYKQRYAVNHFAPLTIILPPANSVGSWVKVSDVAGVAATHNITVGVTGTDSMLGVTSGTFVINTNYGSAEFVVTATGAWRVSRG